MGLEPAMFRLTDSCSTIDLSSLVLLSLYLPMWKGREITLTNNTLGVVDISVRYLIPTFSEFHPWLKCCQSHQIKTHKKFQLQTILLHPNRIVQQNKKKEKVNAFGKQKYDIHTCKCSYKCIVLKLN